MKKISTTTKVYTLNLHNLKMSDNGQPQNVSIPNKPLPTSVYPEQMAASNQISSRYVDAL